MIAATLVWALAAPAAPSAAFEALCAICHGPGGRGDGPAAPLYLPRPRDLVLEPLRNGESVAAVRQTLVSGIPATGMPAFGALPAAKLTELAEEVVALRRAGPRTDRATRPALWPPTPLSWPVGAPPIAQSASARACGRCHPREADAWRLSRHALGFGEGVAVQLPEPHGTAAGACRACHAPLDAQIDDPELRDEGVTCSVCHRRGTEKLSARAPSPGRATLLSVRVDPAFAGPTLCLPCHNLPLSAAVAGSPLLDTFREWAASPYLPAGVSCPTCHLAEADHRLRGAHDPEAVRSAVVLRLETIPGEGGPPLVTLTNIGAGHAFPTTATPRVTLSVRQVDGAGRAIEGTAQAWTLARTVASDDGGRTWRQSSDTRLAAGATTTWRYELPARPEVQGLEAELFMAPDWFYAQAFAARASVDPRFAGAARTAAESGFTVTVVRRPWPRRAATP